MCGDLILTTGCAFIQIRAYAGQTRLDLIEAWTKITGGTPTPLALEWLRTFKSFTPAALGPTLSATEALQEWTLVATNASLGTLETDPYGSVDESLGGGTR